MNDFINRVGEVSLLAKLLYSTLIAMFASAMAYLNIDQEAMFLYFLLLFIDLTTGIAAAMVVKEVITVARLYAGILSKALLFVVPIVAAIIVKMQGDSLLWFIKWTVIVLAISEGISIFNNVLKARKQKQLPEFDAISLVGTKLTEGLEKLFKVGEGKE